MWKLLTGIVSEDMYCKVDINRGIIQGDDLSPLIFVICMITLYGIWSTEIWSDYFKERETC